MKIYILLATILTFVVGSTKAQSSKFSIGIFSDIMLEAPVYPIFYGIQGSYDLKNHHVLQAFAGYSNVNTTTFGADYLYRLKRHAVSGFNIYVGTGVSGDLFRQKTMISSSGNTISVYTKDSYLSVNPTVGLSYRIADMRSIVNVGYKIKYYPFENAADINFLSVGIRYSL